MHVYGRQTHRDDSSHGKMITGTTENHLPHHLDYANGGAELVHHTSHEACAVQSMAFAQIVFQNTLIPISTTRRYCVLKNQVLLELSHVHCTCCMRRQYLGSSQRDKKVLPTEPKHLRSTRGLSMYPVRPCQNEHQEFQRGPTVVLA